MSSVTRSACDACGEVSEPAKLNVAMLDGSDAVAGVRNQEVSPRVFLCADGSTRKLPIGWWIFELTSYDDQHIVAELCPKCADTFGKYVKRKSKRLAEQARAALEAPVVPDPPKLPKPKKSK